MRPLRAPELIEQEMTEIRSRTAPDLVDLRRQVEPQAVKEQVQQSALEYLHGIRNNICFKLKTPGATSGSGNSGRRRCTRGAQSEGQ